MHVKDPVDGASGGLAVFHVIHLLALDMNGHFQLSYYLSFLPTLRSQRNPTLLCCLCATVARKKAKEGGKSGSH